MCVHVCAHVCAGARAGVCVSVKRQLHNNEANYFNKANNNKGGVFLRGAQERRGWTKDGGRAGWL